MFSIIVPVYNAEFDLKELLPLFDELDADKFNIIFIDDGSVDNSAVVISDFIKNKQNYKLHSQDNAGVAEARNKGMEFLDERSKYIMFFDADDSFSPDALNELSDEVFAKNFDIYITNHLNIYHNNNKETKIIAEQSVELLLKASLPKLYESGFIHPCWNKIYKTSFILSNGIKFNKNINMGEDFRFNLTCLKYTSSIFYINKVVYTYYVGNTDSLTSKYHPNSFEYFVDGINLIEALAVMHNCQYTNFSYRYIYALNDRVRNLARSKYPIKKQFKMFRKDFKVARRKIKPSSGNRLTLKERLMYLLLKCNQSNVYFLLVKFK